MNLPKSRSVYCISIYFLVCSVRLFSQITPALSEDEKRLSLKNNLEFESDSRQSFIIYRAYVVRYDTAHRVPKFTIHKLLPSCFVTEKKAKRRSTFYIDDNNLKRLSATNADYKKSGFDRGHMVPAGDYDSNQLLKDETFYLTNICPQTPNLNRGIWKNLEDAIREKVVACDCPAIIITGAIIDSLSEESIGRDRVGVPNYFYKIIFFPSVLKMYAFLFSNFTDSYSKRLEDYQVRVDDIETIVKEDFFDKLDHNVQSELESKKVIFR